MCSGETVVNAKQNQLKLVQDTLLCGDYRSAYREIDNLLRTASNNLSFKEQAKLKYLEALVHLNGKRPYSQSPSVMQSVTGLTRMAGSLHPIFSYPGALAIFKYDFARAGLQDHKVEGDQLMREAQQLLPLKPEDHENINILSKSQPSLYQDYFHYFQL